MNKLLDIHNLLPHKGDVGIEIEVEGVNLPRRVPNWKIEVDGSLRGEALEYITKSGVYIDKVDERIDQLTHSFQKNDGVINDSVRAGVHVHMNMQQYSYTQIGCFATLYYTFENILLKFCGDSREGNLFCLRACDADYVIDYVVQELNRCNPRALYTDKIRYASMNWKPLVNYGSLEFRAMRTDSNLDTVKIWVKILHQLLQSSLKYDTPQDIILEFSAMSTKDFLNKVFGDWSMFLTLDEQELYSGMCNAQDFAYLIDWVHLENSIQEQIDIRTSHEEFMKKQARLIKDMNKGVRRPAQVFVDDFGNAINQEGDIIEEAGDIDEDDWD